MPNFEQVQAVVALAERGLAEVQPGLAAKFAADLPAIFGGNAGKATEALSHAPVEASALGKLASDLQLNLTRFGLPNTATPTELFAAAQEQGLHAKILSSVARRGHSSSVQELALPDGNLLWQTRASGRSLAFRETSFGDAAGRNRITFKSGSFLSEPEQSWDLKTPSMSLEFKLPITAH